MKYLKLLRVKSWIKNGFVVLPAIFSFKLVSVDSLLLVLLSFLSFSMISSVIYVLNDIKDIEEDKLHPRKKFRPLPSGSITIRRAYVLAGTVLAFDIFLAICFFQEDSIILIVYFIVNLLYVYGLKNVVLIDCFIIGANFVLRVIYGSHVLDVEPSKWIISVTFFVALFLAFLKRRSEFLVLKDDAGKHRKVLNEYSLAFLDPIIMICASVVIFSYLMYCLDPTVLFNQSNMYSYFSVVFVVLGVFRYIQINYSNSYDNEGDPTQLIYKDRIIQVVVFGWIMFLLFVIYF